MAKVGFQPVSQVTAQVAVQGGASNSPAVKAWLSVFPLAALGVFLVQPAVMASAALAGGLLLCLALIAIAGVSGADMQRFHGSQKFMACVAPVQLALMIWVSVHAGHALAGDALLLSTLVAFAAFAGLVLADAIVSVCLLLVLGRGSAVSGLTAASLITGKYAGLLGEIR